MQHRLVTLRRLLTILVLIAFLSLHIYLGTTEIINSVNMSYADVFDEYMNSVVRLVFPLIVTILAATPLQDHLGDNFVAFIRGRQPLGQYLTRKALAAVTRNAVYFAILGTLTTLAATYLAPALQPGLVDPHSYKLTANTVLQLVEQQNPLGFALAWGPIVYGLVATLWMAIGAAMFSLAAIAAALIVKNRILALLAPLGFYILESLATQLANASSWCLMFSLPTPSDLQDFPLLSAVISVLGLGAISFAIILITVRRARVVGNYS